MAPDAGNVKQPSLPKEDSKLRKLGQFFRDKPLGAAGGVLFLFMLIVAIFAPWIAPTDPTWTDVMNRLQSPSLEHWMGTDELGRDVLSRVIYGARISALVGIGATISGTTVGAILGLISGFAGGKTDMFMQRIMDMVLAFPALIMAIAIMAVLGPSIVNVIVAIAIPAIPRANRVVRSVALSVKQFQFIEAAKAVGASPTRVIFRHMLPNSMASYLIVATSMLGGAIMIEASLSFLGLGVPPPEPSWGRSLSEAMWYYYGSPWLAIFPGIAISVLIFSANMLGDALRDVWDPRLKRL
jgi:peptide/nickel transport system permease protein